MNNRSKPYAIVIGAGFTGCAIAYDLAKRGFSVSVYERGEICSGTSGRTHGLLHSGGRYCVNDPEAAVECISENIILRNIAPNCIEYNGGLFAALDEEDLAYAPRFEKGAQECDIPIEKLNREEVLKLEPNLTSKVITAYTAPDGAFDPLRLGLTFAASAVNLGAKFFPYHEVKELILDGKGNLEQIRVWDRTSNKEFLCGADIFINATGAWAGKITALAKSDIPVIATPGVMVSFDQRLIQRVINRLNYPGDGDILIPQRRMVVIGTTSFEVEDADYIPIYEDQLKLMLDSAKELVPAVARTNIRGAYVSARPLLGSLVQGRSLSRTFKCFDHKEIENIDRFVTITGGKATTCRIMAEKTVDLVCQKMGMNVQCSTAETELASYRDYYRK